MIKKQYAGWENIQTIQSKEILSELLDAKEFQRAKLLISDTGLGKTNSIEMFKRAKPVHTYVITVGDSFKLVHIVDAILKMLGVEGPKNEWRAGMAKMMINEKLELISEKLATIGNKNGKPVIILDEAENVKPSALKMVKELYDGIHKNCSIVLIGTDQILDSILNRKSKNRQSVPQLWRRFKAGTRYITTLNKARDFKPFFDKYIPGNLPLHDLLNELCENYGELHDYLDEFLRFCSEKNKEINEENFRMYHKVPKAGALRKAS